MWVGLLPPLNILSPLPTGALVRSPASCVSGGSSDRSGTYDDNNGRNGRNGDNGSYNRNINYSNDKDNNNEYHSSSSDCNPFATPYRKEEIIIENESV